MAGAKSEASGAAARPQGATGAKKAGGKAKGATAKKSATRAKTGAQGNPTSPEATKAPTSGLDAAAKVLAEADCPLSCKEIVERAFEKGYWQSDGKTPSATIYSAILREIQKKGDEARFRKADRGKFTLAE